MDLVIPDLTAPPPAFGLGWIPLTGGDGDAPVWVAPTTPVFVEAWRQNFRFLGIRGYRVDDERAPASVSWRREDQSPISPHVAADPMKGIRRVEEGARLYLQRDAEYRAARTPRPAEESFRVRRDLRELVRHKRWSIPRRHLEAGASLGQAEALTPRQNAYAEDIVSQAKGRLAAMHARMTTPLGERCIAIAERPGVSSVIQHALRHISGLDGDRAAERNGVGWDATHSELGHSLAEQEWIGWPENGAALALVHRFRRQLPDDLRGALFACEGGTLSDTDVAAIDAGDMVEPAPAAAA